MKKSFKYLVDIKQSKAVMLSNSCCNQTFNYQGLYNWNPNKWIYLSENSSIHSAICQTKIEMTVGKGLSYVDGGNPEARAFFQSQFVDKDILTKLATDKVIFNNFAMLVKWNLGLTKIGEVEHVPFKKFRLEKNPQNCVYYATVSNFGNNWRVNKLSLPLFHKPTSINDINQFYYKKQYSVGDEIYGIPDYAGAFNYILIDIRLADFHLGNVSRGFFPSVMVETDIEQFIPDPNRTKEMDDNGDPIMIENPEFVQFMEAVEKWYGGYENAGSILFKKKGYLVEKFEASTTVDLFNALNTIATQKIVSSHRLSSPVLVGQAGSGTLSGNAGEISVAAELFYNTVIIPAYQNPILASLKEILRANGFSDKIEIIQSKPVQFSLTEGILKDILTVNELRKIVGYSEIDGGNVPFSVFSANQIPQTPAQFAKLLGLQGEPNIENDTYKAFKNLIQTIQKAS